MGTDLGTPILGGCECGSESRLVGTERSKSAGGEGVDVGRSGGGHFDSIQSNGTENNVDRLDWAWAEVYRG